jgi:hypothetical protein
MHRATLPKTFSRPDLANSGFFITRCALGSVSGFMNISNLASIEVMTSECGGPGRPRCQPTVLQCNRTGHYLLPGEINGRPVRLLLDTGATQV